MSTSNSLGRTRVNFACSENGCENDAHAKQLCQKHYNQQKYLRNSGEIKEHQRLYYQSHKDQYRQYNRTLSGRYGAYRNSAQQRNLSFELTLDEFKSVFGKQCVFCGKVDQQNGIDRIDSSKGYFLDNVQPSCFDCNLMKRTFSNEEFLTHVKRIVLHRGDE